MLKGVARVFLLFMMVITFGVVGNVDVSAREIMQGTGKFNFTIPKDNYKSSYEGSFYSVDYRVEQTGVYKLSVDSEYKDFGICVFDINSDSGNEFANKGELSDEKFLSVYLEKGKEYNLYITIGDAEKKDIDCFLVSELTKEMEYNPEVEAYVNDSKSKKTKFSDYKKKGFSWDKSTNTLTLNNCTIDGSIEVAEVEPEFQYDRESIIGSFNIVLNGKSTIKNNGYDNFYTVDINGVALDISGTGSLKIVAEESIINADIIRVKDATISANAFKAITSKAYFDNAKLDVSLKYKETLKGDTVDDNDVVLKHDQIDFKQIFGEEATVEIKNCDFKLEYELIPAKYLKDNGKYVFYKSFAGCSIKNTKIDVKIQKNLKDSYEKYLKKAKLKKSNTFSYSLIKKSYRNGIKKGTIFYDYNGCIYKVIKAASTDGKYTGKVAIVDIVGSMRVCNFKSMFKLREGHMKYKIVKLAKNSLSKVKSLRKIYIGKDLTTIETKACADNKKLKLVEIKSTKIKKIGKNAFSRNGGKKIKFVVPKKMVKKYTKLLKKAKTKNFVVVGK